MNTKVEINDSITQCHECVFYKEPHDCYLGCIDNYKCSDIQIATTLGGKTYLVDFICPYYRNNFNDVVSALDTDNSFPYFIIMNRPKFKGLLNTILDINRYSIKPKSLHIFLDAKKEKQINIIIKYLSKYACFKWVVHSELTPNTWTQTISNYKNTDFMLYCNNMPSLEYDWANSVYNKINKNLDKCAYFYKNDAMLIPASVYNRYYFEYTTDCLNKIKEYLCHHALEL